MGSPPRRVAREAVLRGLVARDRQPTAALERPQSSQARLALRAVARRLEELPPGSKAIVILQSADSADRREFKTAANVALSWVATDAELLAAVRALVLPAGDGYAWCAGEAACMAALRRELVDVKGHPGEAIRAAAYWKRGARGHHENL